jgi:uncharacterized membrane protein
MNIQNIMNVLFPSMTNVSPYHRIIEIDFLRTVAIVLMIIYHTAYDVTELYGWDIDIFDGWWRVLARGAAILFLSLVGISFSVSWKRTAPSRRDRYFYRGGFLVACGLLVSTATYIADPDTYVRFGILHCIGVSMILLPFFMWLKEGSIPVGIFVMWIGRYAGHLSSSTSLLIPVGITPLHFRTVDYFPIFPWFGVILIGCGLGHFLYVRHSFGLLRNTQWVHWTLWPARHSLAIYLMHQPIILVGMRIIFGKPGV